MNSNMWWISPLVLVAIRLLFSEAKYTRVSKQNSILVFKFTIVMKLLIVVGITIFIVLWIKSIGTEEAWIVALGPISIILLCLGWPSTIMIDSLGITRHLWWKPIIFIPWESVIQLEKRAGGDWMVYGKNGKSFMFSRFHCDPKRFELEVLKRSGIKKAINLNSKVTLSSSLNLKTKRNH